MDFLLTEEQRSIRELARRIAGETARAEHVDSAILREAIRRADLPLVHLADRGALATRRSRAET